MEAISKYKVQMMIGGEWTDWTPPAFDTYEQASQFIFDTVRRADDDDSAKDINRWRPVEVLA